MSHTGPWQLWGKECLQPSVRDNDILTAAPKPSTLNPKPETLNPKPLVVSNQQRQQKQSQGARCAAGCALRRDLGVYEHRGPLKYPPKVGSPYNKDPPNTVPLIS